MSQCWNLPFGPLNSVFGHRSDGVELAIPFPFPKLKRLAFILVLVVVEVVTFVQPHHHIFDETGSFPGSVFWEPQGATWVRLVCPLGLGVHGRCVIL